MEISQACLLAQLYITLTSQDIITHLLVLLCEIAPPLCSAVYNKQTEHLGCCGLLHQRAQSTPSHLFCLCVSVLVSLPRCPSQVTGLGAVQGLPSCCMRLVSLWQQFLSVLHCSVVPNLSQQHRQWIKQGVLQFGAMLRKEVKQGTWDLWGFLFVSFERDLGFHFSFITNLAFADNSPLFFSRHGPSPLWAQFRELWCWSFFLFPAAGLHRDLCVIKLTCFLSASEALLGPDVGFCQQVIESPIALWFFLALGLSLRNPMHYNTCESRARCQGRSIFTRTLAFLSEPEHIEC